jgi:dienelactone hydrolase
MPGAGRWLIVVVGVLALTARGARAERIVFETAARDTTAPRIFQGQAAYSDRISGELRLPQGAGPFPAMVIMHSSRGVVPAIGAWAKLFTDLGVAAFVVDSFGPRGLTEATSDRLTFPAGVVDALRALKALQHDPRIDASRIGVIGFSRGAVAAMDSAFERYRSAVVGEGGGRFALHVVFYGGCGQFAATTPSPILAFVGDADDFNNLDLCKAQAEALRRQGSDAELIVYPGAIHGFDTDYPRQVMPMIQNFRNCRMLQNLDTFEAALADGRALTLAERLAYPAGCAGRGAARGGDRKSAAAARERVRAFVAERLALAR